MTPQPVGNFFSLTFILAFILDVFYASHWIAQYFRTTNIYTVKIILRNGSSESAREYLVRYQIYKLMRDTFFLQTFISCLVKQSLHGVIEFLGVWSVRASLL